MNPSEGLYHFKETHGNIGKLGKNIHSPKGCENNVAGTEIFRQYLLYIAIQTNSLQTKKLVCKNIA
jgi:hypothetical protein